MAHETFRSAFNGFNREDVVRYLEYLNAQHTAEVNRLRSELEFLRGNAPQETVAAEDNSELIEQQAARIRELFDLCKEKDETIAQLTARLEESVAISSAEEELEAYRRAERAERVAQERANQIYQQVNGALADATVKVDDAAALISRMANELTGQMEAFQVAVTGSKQALRDAVDAMYAARPEAEKE